jgi:methyl-accepting chemotaxis protein
MDFLRRFSIGSRVQYGFLTLGVLALVMSLSLAWMNHGLEARLGELALHAGKAQNGSLPADFTALREQGHFLTLAACVAGTLFFALAVALGTMIRASIKGPVEALVASVQRLGAGDLETKISSPGRDDIAWLNHELNTMRKKLRETVKSVRDSAESVRLAAGEIAQGNADLSARTENQAAALEQTSSSMHQLAGTVQENANFATEASAIVNQANQVAAHGGELMQEVVARMGDINVSATRIAEIVQVIDGIAFQTNILALNAAVEAARAGEQGRGFAVVASEVRGLAQRSATAAKEVKTLITDSADKVNVGFKLVDEAGKTMQDILGGVSKVSRLVADMATAGQTQSGEIAQIHQAISQMDDMTQRNAALVEEASAAALSLRDQSERLTESMSGFKIAA